MGGSRYRYIKFHLNHGERERPHGSLGRYLSGRETKGEGQRERGTSESSTGTIMRLDVHTRRVGRMGTAVCMRRTGEEARRRRPRSPRTIDRLTIRSLGSNCARLLRRDKRPTIRRLTALFLSLGPSPRTPAVQPRLSRLSIEFRGLPRRPLLTACKTATLQTGANYIDESLSPGYRESNRCVRHARASTKRKLFA